MTTLSATQIAQLTAILTGGGFKRAANVEAAAKRFRNVASERSIQNAEAILAMDFEQASRMVEMIANDQANTTPPVHVGATAAPEAIKTSPGLARLRAAQDAEAIRSSTNAEADAARAAVVTGMPSARKAALDLGVEPTKPARKVKAEKPAKVEGAKTRTKTDAGAKIATVVANPKKAGSKSFAIFSLYAAGQTAEEFIKAVVAAGYSESDAKGNLSWDRRHGFITFEEAEAEEVLASTGRPGDAAAMYAQENGVSYERALVACNMD